MRIAVHAVGRMKAGPERELGERYLDRFRKAGQPLGFDFRGVAEIPESRSHSLEERRRDEAERMIAGIPEGGELLLLDETGQSVGSEDFAALLAHHRDAGVRELAIAIGGPDGFDRAFLDRARHRLSFGKMTWPHQLARVMLAEQLYRAATILSGHPYHRI